MTSPSPRPDVSVLMMSYNHARYIEEAIQSVYAQQLTGVIQLVVADDASPDDTASVVRRVAASAPPGVVVDAVLREDNVGGHANFADAWGRCRGRYIALLEGDDFWTRPDKLQVCVSALDANPRAVMAFHGVTGVDQDGSPRQETWPPTGSREFTLRTLIHGNFAQTCSVVYRAGVVPVVPQWTFQLPIGDWPLSLLHALEGDICYLDVMAAAYRFHDGGLWSGRPEKHRQEVSADVLAVMADNLEGRIVPSWRMRRRARQLRRAARA